MNLFKRVPEAPMLVHITNLIEGEGRSYRKMISNTYLSFSEMTV